MKIQNYLFYNIDNSLNIKLWINNYKQKQLNQSNNNKEVSATKIAKKLQNQLIKLSNNLQIKFEHHIKMKNKALIKIIFNNIFNEQILSKNHASPSRLTLLYRLEYVAFLATSGLTVHEGCIKT